MSDFFERQDLARRKTGQLIALFCLAVIFIIVSVYLALRGIFFWQNLQQYDAGAFLWWDAQMFSGVAVGTLALIGGGSLLRIRQLRDGGHSVAAILGGRQVPPASLVPQERQLLNIVEEMAIASGVPVPDVYVLDHERGINAFAAGFSYDDAIICVTAGSLQLLSRDELQGVIAHEFSHIFNADTLINIRLIGWLHGILLISLAGEWTLRALGRGRGRRGIGAVGIGLVLYILGYLGVFFGKLIKSAISRQREYLADASAVQFTRNPAGLGGALKKIGGLSESGRIRHHLALETSHMYFCNGLREAWFKALATHPPLVERIRSIDPAFDDIFPEVIPLAPPAAPPVTSPPIEQANQEPPPQQVISDRAITAILATVGAPMAAHQDQARKLLSEIPPALIVATRDALGARCLIYALLLNREAEARDQQIALLRTHEPDTVREEVVRLSAKLQPLSPRARLPLVDLALPSLRLMSAEQYQHLHRVVEGLSITDRKTSSFEFALKHVLLRHLDTRFHRPRRTVTQIYSVRGVTKECSSLLSLFARIGQRTQKEIDAAFTVGAAILREPQAQLALLAPDECRPSVLNNALDTLAVTSPPIKRRLLAALLECMLYDQQVDCAEVELFRAIADALGCPVPPWLSATRHLTDG